MKPHKGSAFGSGPYQASCLQVCPLAVPKCIVRLTSESEDEYLKRWQYQRVEVLSKETKQIEEGWEDKDDFLQRLTAQVQLLAAFIQCPQQQRHGLEQGWAYLARYSSTYHSIYHSRAAF